MREATKNMRSPASRRALSAPADHQVAHAISYATAKKLLRLWPILLASALFGALIGAIPFDADSIPR
jgi:hypothetical protein